MIDTKQQIAFNQINRIKDELGKKGYTISEPAQNEYSYLIAISKLKEKISLHIFFGKKGNKTLIQGNKDSKLYKEINDYIFGEKFISDDKPETEPDYPYIGTDESGKGDYFGSLVIAGVYITPREGNILRSLEIRDSKELSDQQVIQLTSKIKSIKEIIYDLIVISPEKYNQLYEKMGNLNRLMGWAHAKVIENILERCNATEAISDKFGNEKIILEALQTRGQQINLTQITKAEKFTAVATASILARNAVIEWFNIQSKKLKIQILKGSSEEVEKVAKKIFENYGEDTLKKLVKLHFKTSKKIFSN